MSKMGFIFEWAFKLIGLLFVYLFIRQFIDAVTGDNRFLFFEIILLIVWIGGVFIFSTIGIAIGRVRRSEIPEKHDEV